MDLAAVVTSGPEIVKVKGGENETVEVVSTNENVLSGDATETLQEMVSSVQFPPMPSGMIEIDGQSLNLVDMSDPPSIASSNAMAAAIAIGSSGKLSSPLVVEAGVKRPIMTESLVSDTTVPRKKSRNYLDSHKTIEKKRRDRINSGLMTLREIIPDCKQYGSKKLDKAEILEMSIDYIQKLQSQNNGRQVNTDLIASQKEWASEIMTWIFQNKLLHSGPNALEQFCNSLLLHLQSYGNQTTTSTNTPSASNLLLLGQGNGSSSNEEDQLTLLQQLANTANNTQSPIKDSTTAQVQNAQLALLLLQQQQQQQLLHQQQPDTSTAEPSTADTTTTEGQNQIQQLQQLQHLQMLLLQHLANPANQKQPTVSTNQGCTETGDQVPDAQAIVVDQNISTSITEGTPGVELTLSSATSTSDNLSAHYSGNLLVGQDTVDPSTSQMWSQPAERSPLLIGTQESAMDDSVQEVELIGQDH